MDVYKSMDGGIVFHEHCICDFHVAVTIECTTIRNVFRILLPYSYTYILLLSYDKIV